MNEDLPICLTRRVIFEKYREYPIVGYKGTSLLEVGYIFAPYIPVNLISEISELDFIPNVSIQSRYATTKVNANFYSVIHIG